MFRGCLTSITLVSVLLQPKTPHPPVVSTARLWPTLCKLKPNDSAGQNSYTDAYCICIFMSPKHCSFATVIYLCI